MSQSDLARDLARIDRASWLHPFSSLTDQAAREPLAIAEARGSRVRDASGRWYLDAMSGLWCVNAGHGRREIADAMAEQAGRLAYYHGFAGAVNEPAVRLAEKLLSLAPVPMSRVFFASSGSEANDTQIKLIWQYHHLRGKPAKRKLVARRRGYHGSTVAAASLTGLPYAHAGFGLPLPGFAHVSPAHWPSDSTGGESEAGYAKRLARELEDAIVREGPDTVAAFFAEPVMGAGGVLIPPASYFAEIQPVLRRHDVLLVADEVICGFGRLGRWFGSQRFGIEPDLITLAKGITSGYVPLSACLVSAPIVDVLTSGARELGAFNHGYTYSGHPVAAAAALANLAIFEREKLVDAAEQTGARLQQQLRARCATHPRVRDVRGLGMIAAVEPHAADDAKRLQALLLQDGVITRVVGGAVAMSPPLIFTADECDELIAALARALDKLA
jgi:L-2,4-diaminobutyrate transaminase